MHFLKFIGRTTGFFVIYVLPDVLTKSVLLCNFDRSRFIVVVSFLYGVKTLTIIYYLKKEVSYVCDDQGNHPCL